MSDKKPGNVTIEFPAAPTYVRVARLTAASLASRAGLDLDRVEDIRVAFDEIVVLLGIDEEHASGDSLEIPEETGSIKVSFYCSEGKLRIESSTDAGEGGYIFDELALQVLEALSDSHSVRTSGSLRHVVATFTTGHISHGEV